MLSRVIRRVNDEEGVKKLVVETFSSLWLQPVKYSEELQKKVTCMRDMMRVMGGEGGGHECVEAVLITLLKVTQSTPPSWLTRACTGKQR